MKYLFLSILCLAALHAAGQQADAIAGKWIAWPKKNVVVEVYQHEEEFRGKVIWFNDRDDKSKPMDVRTDEKNPDKNLRNRKLLGMEVLTKLKYNPKTNKWEQGTIYDATSGKEWSSSAWLLQDSTLNVRGFWMVELF